MRRVPCDRHPFAHPTLYAGRLVSDGNGTWSLIGFHGGEDSDDGEFAGELSDPIVVRYRPDAGLVAAGPTMTS